MTIDFKICCFIAFVSALTTFACDKKDGVFVISPHLKNDSEIIDTVKKSEVLAKRKDWQNAALEIKMAERNNKCEELSCGEECGLILKCAYLSYLFNARHDDPEILLKAEEALVEYADKYKENFSRNYAELYVLLMAYYWSLNDTASHDETLKLRRQEKRRMICFAVIDTNVIVSAAIKLDSIPGRILALVLLGEISPVFSNEIQ